MPLYKIWNEDGSKRKAVVASDFKDFVLKETSDDMARWHPNGPTFNFFPYPMIDDSRPWGEPCNSCGGRCSGHYITDVNKLLALHQKGKMIRALPPSQVIEEEVAKAQDIQVTKLAQKCCLKEEHVSLWLDHLRQTTINRVEGAKKAKETLE